ncbi:MAG TPA: MarR family transcriptional regulator [Solirubrobacteraceae bacterium]|jgi:DNA-binding MarR family transcriptional regulator|nr:MarR family transcriptional regulator [Solirubrobacteraceae bacterium]
MASDASTVQDVIDLIRQMSGQNLLLSEAIARRAGLRSADLEILGVIEQHGPMTAGELAGVTGLSPAAVTGLIDRLERAGVAERRSDPVDRRRVLVAVSAGAARVAALYEALERDTRAKTRRYSAAERAVIARFLRDMYDIGVDHVSRLDAD